MCTLCAQIMEDEEKQVRIKWQKIQCISFLSECSRHKDIGCGGVRDGHDGVSH